MVLPSGGPVCANVLDIIVLCIMCVAQLSISGMLLCQCGVCHERVERRSRRGWGIGIVKGIYYNIGILDGLPQ